METAMNDLHRLRTDVALAQTKDGILLRHGSEETLKLEGAKTIDADRDALIARGIMVDTPPEADWQRALCGGSLTKKIFLGDAPAAFRRPFEEQCMIGPDSDSSAVVTLEIGVDLPRRRIDNQYAWKTRRPWLWVQVPGPLEARWCVFVPGETACADCLERRLLACRKNPSEYSELLEVNASRLPAVPSPALLSSVGGLVAIEAIRLLSGCSVDSVGRVWNMDFRYFKLTAERLLPIPGCATCS
jgi:bacteriocin biosynthesis cyclodehydratase domain-containing protein